MKKISPLKKITLTTLALTLFSFAGVAQVVEQKFTPEIKILGKLTTIMLEVGEVGSDEGDNVSNYVSKRIKKGNIALDNEINISLCGEKTYIISIGINQYKQGINLTNSIKDAETIANKVESSCSKTKTYLLKNASAKEIEERVTSVANKASSKDSIIFSFAGHGVRVKEKDYLLTTNIKFNANDIVHHALSLGSIETELKASKTKRVVMIVDASRDSLFKTK